MNIAQVAPLSWASNPEVRLLRQVHASHNAEGAADNFNPSSLHEKKVKHYITEIYAAHKNAQRTLFEQHVASAPLPMLSLQVDFVKSKVSNEQFFGEE